MEFHVEDTVCNKAKEAGWLCRKLAWVGRKGAPDRMFAKKGRFVLIEFKDENKQPTIVQQREIARLIAAGFEVHWTDSVPKALKILGIE